MSDGFDLVPPDKSVYSEMDRITKTFLEKMAQACQVPPRYLYPLDMYLDCYGPFTKNRIKATSPSQLYAVVKGHDVYEHVPRSAPCATMAMARVWLNDIDASNDKRLMPYRGPISGQCYVVVNIENMVTAERKAETEREFNEEMGITVDGLTREECFRRYVEKQRNDKPINGVKLFLMLTPRQEAVARAEWTMRLKKKINESNEKERNQIVCQSQYDLDE